MIRGSCLCGRVRFEIERAVGPFELCHCTRCRKTTGAASFAGLGVAARDFRWVGGQDSIRCYDAPIRERPPAYRASFCIQCGSPVPNPQPDARWIEVPAGLLDDDPHYTPDRHIFVEFTAAWDTLADDLPKFDKATLIAHRTAAARERDP